MVTMQLQAKAIACYVFEITNLQPSYDKNVYKKDQQTNYWGI